MGMPISCPICGETIGSLDPIGLPILRGYISTNYLPCPGTCRHAKPVKKVEKHLLGMVKRTALFYPETSTLSSWNEYVGPRSIILLSLALLIEVICYGSRDLWVDDSIVNWHEALHFRKQVTGFHF
jgi:hypothetical protein